ncbi:uncharacterized protein LOC142523380 [Primulina tabacum]|uniref:uncharacterized protein LOC142523380 n=1 Tax=Primulina tabacum TaxID=48773 RepID=UPI003F5AB9B3
MKEKKVPKGYTQQLQLCSITLMTGLVICLRSAAKIIHKAQAITSLAANWHACTTIYSFDELDYETPMAEIASVRTSYPVTSDLDSDNEEVEDDELDNTNLVPVFANTVFYQRGKHFVSIIH